MSVTKYYIKTYGCQMNVLDSEVISGLLQGEGMSAASCMDEAGVIVLNTCCVREKTEHKVYGKLGQIKKLKERNPGLVVALCGCMAQAYGEELLQKSYPLDLVLGPGAIDRLPRALRRINGSPARLSKGDRVFCGLNGSLPPYENAVRRGGTSAFVEIMRGCDNYCTYCVVPYVRGGERSRAAGELEKEVGELAGRGFRQVVLIGQNVNSYRDGDTAFPALLRRLAGVPGLKRLRFMTSHPKDLSPELIETMADSLLVCEHLHLPLQAGSDSVLGRMGRGYSCGDYLRLVEKVRARLPGISLSTDLMVGFPGETEEEFRETLSTVEKARFNFAFTFVYTDRPMAKASAFPDKVPVPVRRQRLHELNKMQDAVSAELAKDMVGKKEVVLVESENQGGKGWRGRTRTNYLVFFEGDTAVGEEVDVEITSAKTWTLFGRKAS